VANEFKLPVNPFKFGSPEYDEWNYQHPGAKGGTDVALDEARGSLARANEFSDQTDSGHLANLPASLAALRQPEDTRGLARRITEPLSNVGNMALAAAIPASINPAIGGTLGAAGGLAVIPDLARRALMPEEGEERPGGVELALSAAGASPGLRALKMLGKGAPFIGPLGDLEGAANIGGRALAYEGPQVARGARSAVPAIDKLMASESFAGLPRGQVSLARKVSPRSPVIGEPQGAQTFANAVREQATKPFFKMNAEGAFGGDRSVRGIGGLEQEGEGGLRKLALASMKKKPGAYSNPKGVMQDLEEGYRRGLQPSKEVSLDIPSVEPLDPFEKLAARSRERFGRKFYKE